MRQQQTLISIPPATEQILGGGGGGAPGSRARRPAGTQGLQGCSPPAPFLEVPKAVHTLRGWGGGGAVLLPLLLGHLVHPKGLQRQQREGAAAQLGARSLLKDWALSVVLNWPEQKQWATLPARGSRGSPLPHRPFLPSAQENGRAEGRPPPGTPSAPAARVPWAEGKPRPGEWRPWSWDKDPPAQICEATCGQVEKFLSKPRFPYDIPQTPQATPRGLALAFKLCPGRDHCSFT